MRCVKRLIPIFLMLLLAACGQATDGVEIDGAKESMFGYYSGLNHKSGLHWTYYQTQTPGAAKAAPEGFGDTVVEDNSETPPAETIHVLLTGTIKLTGFTGGSFQVATYGTKSCGEEVCADKDGVPTAAKTFQKPGFYSLIVPVSDQAQYLVVTYHDDQGQTTSQEIYVGTPEGRMD
ncbi:MAG: hypothetical protein R3257_05270, partial [bacterium]|nr:hypothetical protein [bacterium]